jgi:general secretion pathway protein M
MSQIVSPSFWTKLKPMHRPGAVALYVGLILVALILAVTAFSAVGERRATIAAEETMLAQLEGRSLFARKDDGSPFGSAPDGSPFLQGSTVNVAGAALLQRVASAIGHVNGTVLSSQVDLQKADAKDGWIGLVVSCEVEQPALQQLLYDIEAGMPFLFVDQLVVDAPTAGAENGRMKVLLSVSGQWLNK